MISPYVRRRRLAAEILRLREEHGYPADKLAKAIGVARQRISRLENGHVRPDLNEIIKILDILGVGEKRWSQILTIAREAQERGWWESYAEEMGTRQSLYANLEAGAATIREYQQSFVPGLLQTPEFTRARIEVDKAAGPLNFDPDRAIEARLGRQRMLRRPGGPTYEAIIDEVVVRRLPASPHVMRAQLGALAAPNSSPRITIRVLPVDARVAGYRMPRSAFSLYTYADPGDPVVAAVDTVTSDLALIERDKIEPYLELYGRLRDAALTPDESRRFLKETAQRLTGKTEDAS